MSLSFILFFIHVLFALFNQGFKARERLTFRGDAAPAQLTLRSTAAMTEPKDTSDSVFGSEVDEKQSVVPTNPGRFGWTCHALRRDSSINFFYIPTYAPNLLRTLKKRSYIFRQHDNSHMTCLTFMFSLRTLKLHSIFSLEFAFSVVCCSAKQFCSFRSSLLKRVRRKKWKRYEYIFFIFRGRAVSSPQKLD